MTIGVGLIIVLSVSLNVAAQIFLKKGLLVVETSASWAIYVWKLCMNPYMVAGMACYVLSVGVWLYVLSRIQVSIAYPLTGIGYVIAAVAGIAFLGENVTLLRWIGIGVITIGVYLVSRSSS